jgi:hypothetical protein
MGRDYVKRADTYGTGGTQVVSFFMHFLASENYISRWDKM